MSERQEAAAKYVENMSTDFSVKDFVEHLKTLSKFDMSAHLVHFSHKFHKSNFMFDMAAFSATGTLGHRHNDINEELRPLLSEFIELAKSESMEFMAFSLAAFMPIRFYFIEIKEFARYFNALVDIVYDDESIRRRKKFLYHEFEKEKENGN